jgi:hypothetical protein
MTKNELRRVLYDSDEGRALGKSSLGAPIEIGVGGGLLGGAPYVAPALPSGSSGISDVVANTQPVINQPAITQPVINQTVDQIAAGQQTIGDTLTDTDMSTATPSTFDLYGSQIDQLMPIYQQELGRSIQDPAALAFYGDMLKNGVSPDEIRRQIAGSSEGQGFVTSAEQAAINAQNLGFGATAGNGADDAEQVRLANQLLVDNSDYRLSTSAGPPNSNLGYDANDQGDLTNVFTGASDYLQGFATEMTKVLDNGLVGKIANTLEGKQTSAALVDATGAPEEDINLALEIFNTGSEVIKAGFKMTPLGQLITAIVPSLGADGRLVSSNTTDSSYTTGNNDNSVTVSPLNNSIYPNSGRFD